MLNVQCLLNRYLCGTIAVFLEGSILVAAALIAIVQLMDESLAQYAFALAMDEDNFLSLLVLVFIHRLREHIHLIMKDISRIHSSSCFKYLVRMKVYYECAIILLALLLAGIGNHLLVLVHLLLQSFGVDNKRTRYLKQLLE